jgi:prepilin-type N-terminal cleavage/methylation domain-containing protein
MKNNNTGFTLVELMVAMFMFSAIVAGVAGFSAYYFKNYAFSFEENQQIGLAQYAMTSMIREIREARSGDDGSWPIVQADDNTFIFYSDITNDGRPDRIRYFIQGTELRKGIIQPTAVPVSYPSANESVYIIATSIDVSGGPIFRYYNGNWPSDVTNNPLTLANRILNTRYVTVNLKINQTQNFAAQAYQLTSGVTIRSLKNNL